MCLAFMIHVNFPKFDFSRYQTISASNVLKADNIAVLISLLDTDKLLLEGETSLMAFSNAAE